MLRNFLLATIVVSLFSCSKENGIEPVKSNLSSARIARSNEAKLLSGNSLKVWEIREAYIFGTDITATFPVCVLDNKLVFKRNGDYMEFEGAEKCDSQDPYLFGKGTWALNEKGDVISMDIVQGNLQYEIVSITEHDLKVRLKGDTPVEFHMVNLDKRINP